MTAQSRPDDAHARAAHALSGHQVQVLRSLEAGPRSVSEIAASWPASWLAHSPSLAPRLPLLLPRMLWKLEALGYVERVDQARAALTVAGQQRLQSV